MYLVKERAHIIDVHNAGRRLAGQTMSGQELAAVITCRYDDFCDGRPTIAETLSANALDPDVQYRVESVTMGSPAVCARIRAVKARTTICHGMIEAYSWIHTHNVSNYSITYVPETWEMVGFGD